MVSSSPYRHYACNKVKVMIKYTVKRSRRNTIAIQVNISQGVVVKAPLTCPDDAIARFVAENQKWIENQLEKMADRIEKEKKAMADLHVLSRLEMFELERNALRVIPERVKHYAPIVGVKYGRITIRNQRTRWGSCSAQGNLNFNIALMRVPLEVLDYVVVHELCHRIELNHSPRFWALVEKVIPDYKKHQKWLKDNGSRVMKEVGIR